jgi:hypothetical protein
MTAWRGRSRTKKLQEFEAKKDKLLREAKNKQAAELTARSDMTSEATQKLLESHQQELEELLQSQDDQKRKQKQMLQQKLEERRKTRQGALADKQKSERAKEQLEQQKELSDAQCTSVKDAEKEAMVNAIRENGSEQAEYIIKKVLEQRQAKEMANLDQEYAQEKKVEIDGGLAQLAQEHLQQREDLKEQHDRQYQELENEGLSEDELQQRKAELFNLQQVEKHDGEAAAERQEVRGQDGHRRLGAAVRQGQDGAEGAALPGVRRLPGRDVAGSGPGAPKVGAAGARSSSGAGQVAREARTGQEGAG